MFSFLVYDPRLERNLAERKQFPLMLAYALTIHKAQGMSLPSVVIDSTYINKPGQFGVAIGRALSTDGLQVQNFKMRHCIRQPDSLNRMYQVESHPLLIDVTCCRPSVTLEDDKHGKDEDDLEVDDGGNGSDPEDYPDRDNHPARDVHFGRDDHHGRDDNSSRDDYAVQHDDDDDEHTDGNSGPEDDEWDSDILGIIEQLGGDTAPEIDPNLTNLIEAVMFSESITQIHIEVNQISETLKTDDIGRLSLFCRIQTEQLAKLYTDTAVAKHTQKDHNSFYTAVKQYQCSVTFRDHCRTVLFNTNTLSQAQDHVSFRLFEEIRKKFIVEKETENATCTADSSARHFQENLTDGQGKVRYVGAYTLAKKKYKLHSKLKSLVHSTDQIKRKEMVKINETLLYIDHITRSQCQILEDSTMKDSLKETERRQNIRQSSRLC